jgi:hypothetical protein
MKRREFLKNAGIATGGAVVATISFPEAEEIKGELAPERTLEIMTRKGAEPTLPELRMLMRDAKVLPDPYRILAMYQVSNIVLYELPDKMRMQACMAPEFADGYKDVAGIINRMNMTAREVRRHG